MLEKVAVVGAGNVGATAAQRLAEKNLARTVVMIDVVEGVPQGKGLDQWQSGPIEGFDTRVIGTNGYDEAAGAEVRLLTLPVLVGSREGYRNLCRLVTTMKLRAPKGEGALTLDDLDGQVAGLTALVGRAAINGPRFGVGGLVDRLVGVFGAPNVCVALQRHLFRDEESDNQALLDLGSAFHLPIIATNGVL